MDFNEYQKLAASTASTTDESAMPMVGLGIAGEAGEVADYIKKVLFHGHTLDKEKLIKEIGDVLWYCALGATVLGVGLEEISIRNIDKLRKRYPNGFTTQSSIHRGEE